MREERPGAMTEENEESKGDKGSMPPIPPPPPPAGGESDSGPAKTFDAEYVSKLRAEAAKHRTEARAAQAKAKKFDEAEAAQKSDLQKAQEEADQSKAELAAVQTELLRTRIASEKSLPSAFAQRLRGANAEEMQADADVLIAELGKQYVPKAGSNPASTGAGVAGEAPDYEAMSPKELVKLVRNREG